MQFCDVIFMIIYIFRDFCTHFHFFFELFIQMFEPKFLSIICTRGIMVSSLGFESKLLGSIPNSGYLYCFSIFVNCYFSKHKFYNLARLNLIIHSADLYENFRHTSMYSTPSLIRKEVFQLKKFLFGLVNLFGLVK